MRIVGSGLLSSVALLGILLLAPSAQAQYHRIAEDFHNLNDARGAVHHAIMELYETHHNFHGRRDQAAMDARRARHQLALCTGADDRAESYQEQEAERRAHSFRLSSPFFGERHPRIQASIAALDRAIIDLKDTRHIFGNHREAALHDCFAARRQLYEILNHLR